MNIFSNLTRNMNKKTSAGSALVLAMIIGSVCAIAAGTTLVTVTSMQKQAKSVSLKLITERMNSSAINQTKLLVGSRIIISDANDKAALGSGIILGETTTVIPTNSKTYTTENWKFFDANATSPTPYMSYYYCEQFSNQDISQNVCKAPDSNVKTTVSFIRALPTNASKPLATNNRSFLVKVSSSYADKNGAKSSAEVTVKIDGVYKVADAPPPETEFSQCDDTSGDFINKVVANLDDSLYLNAQGKTLMISDTIKDANTGYIIEQISTGNGLVQKVVSCDSRSGCAPLKIAGSEVVINSNDPACPANYKLRCPCSTSKGLIITSKRGTVCHGPCWSRWGTGCKKCPSGLCISSVTAYLPATDGNGYTMGSTGPSYRPPNYIFHVATDPGNRADTPCPVPGAANNVPGVYTTPEGCEYKVTSNGQPWPNKNGSPWDPRGGQSVFTWVLPSSQVSPLIIDLTNSGIKYLDMSKSVDFDYGTGPLSSSWIDNENGTMAFLAYDKNGDGQINDVGELFGAQFLEIHDPEDETIPINGFDDLKKYDDNNDGVIDAKDAIWPKLSLWIDYNSNAITDEGELISITETGITSINLNYEARVDFADYLGNQSNQRSTVTFNDGSSRFIYDVWFVELVPPGKDMNNRPKKK